MRECAPQEKSSGLPTAPAPGPVHPPSPQPLGSMATWELQCWVPHCVPFSVCAPEEQFILAQVALLEQVEALVPMLDSTHLKGTSLGL